MSDVMNDTMMVTDSQSYSTVIRDVLFAKCATLPFFEGFTARRVKQLPTQPYHLPYLGVYIIDEVMVPDGDWDAGMYKFMHDLRIGFSVQMEDNDPLTLELKLDEAFWVMMHGLWRDQYMMSMIDTVDPETGDGNPDNTRMEGITRMNRRHNWGPGRANNETPWAELQFDVTIRHRTFWRPIIDFNPEADIRWRVGGKYTDFGVARIIQAREFRPNAQNQ